MHDANGSTSTAPAPAAASIPPGADNNTANMVDASRAKEAKEVQHDNIETLLTWLATFKGFHNKLALKAADGAPWLVVSADSRRRPWSLRVQPGY